MILAIDPIELECPHCKENKPIENFDFGKSWNNGRSKWCKDCKIKYKKDYGESHSGEIKRSYILNKDKYNASRNKIYQDDKENGREKLKKWYDNHTRSRLWSSAKRRAKVHNIAFNISKEDIIIPGKCPALGIILSVGTGNAHDESPSLDRIIPSKGYVRGNVVVVSHKANTIKSNATIDEIRQVLEFYQNLIKGDG